MRYDSAPSVLSAPTASVPPWALTTFELTMPSEALATIAGIAGFGVADFRTTVYEPRLETVTPASRKDGLPFRLISRRKEKTTSFAVSRVPSEKRTSLRRVNVYVRAPFDAL